MAYISFQPSDFFNTILYTGDGTSDQDVTGVGFQPDWVWLKARSQGYNHRLYDSSRGVLKNLQSNSDAAEATATNGLISFDTDGFSVSQGGDEYNRNGETYVGWNWKANGGTTSSNTDGSITSTVQANTTSGFSIVQYTGTGSNATVGHGLGVKPKVIIVKEREITKNWGVFHDAMGATKYLKLNTTDAAITATDVWNSTNPTSSVFSIGNASTSNPEGRTMIAYCFAEIKGFSHFGSLSYTGNGSSDGPFIYTGFRPGFVIIKRIDSTGGAEWVIQDCKRRTFNPVNVSLYPNLSNAEATGETFRVQDFCSNGFKIRSSTDQFNGNGASYISMAFAEFPLIGSNGQVGTAR